MTKLEIALSICYILVSFDTTITLKKSIETQYVQRDKPATRMELTFWSLSIIGIFLFWPLLIIVGGANRILVWMGKKLFDRKNA